jgi:hypothetical protein
LELAIKPGQQVVADAEVHVVMIQLALPNCPALA